MRKKKCQDEHGGNPPECSTKRGISTFPLYILHPLDLHKSSNSPVSQSSQAANREVKGRDGCDEIFLQPKSEAERETAELITFIGSCGGKSWKKGVKHNVVVFACKYVENLSAQDKTE